MAGHRVAVVGATGAAGQMTLRILEERKFPVRELRAFASERSVGKTVTFAGEPIRVEKVDARRPSGASRSPSSRPDPPSRRSTRRWPSGRAPWSWTSRTPSGWTRRSRSWCPRSTPTPSAGTGASWRARTAPPSSRSCRWRRSTGRLASRRVVATSYQAVSGAGVRGVEELRAADPGVGARRGDRPELLPAPDRLQPDPAHRPVRRRAATRARR